MVKRYLKTCKPFAPYATLENPMCIRANKSLDASGGSVFLNLLGAAKGALIRAAASTQTLCGLLKMRSLDENKDLFELLASDGQTWLAQSNQLKMAADSILPNVVEAIKIPPDRKST